MNKCEIIKKILWNLIVSIMFGVTSEYWQVGVAIFLIGIAFSFKDKILKLPRTNYHILGYITVLYLFFIIVCSWDNKIDYGYYEFLRWSVSSFAFWSAYKINQKQNNIWFLIFMAIGILFNPIVKLTLDKDLWQIIDVITLFSFCLYGFKNRTNV